MTYLNQLAAIQSALVQICAQIEGYGNQLVAIGNAADAEIASLQSAPPPPLPDPTKAASLSEAVTKLNAAGSGWCELGVSISTVWPTNLPYYSQLCASGGPKDILIAWNGMAFDKVAKKLYFVANGGHAGWQGNGAYEFDLPTGTWTRIVDPLPLDWVVNPKPTDATKGDTPYGTYWLSSGQTSGLITDPAKGPTAGHTYGGVQFASKTGTIFWCVYIYATPVGMFYSGGELWEFNPSATDTRNGLAPRTWKMHSVKMGGFPTLTELPDGTLYGCPNWTTGFTFDPANVEATFKTSGGMGGNFGDGSLIYDAPRSTNWFISSHLGIYNMPTAARGSLATGMLPGQGSSGALRNGKIISWSGRNYVVEFDPDTKAALLFDWTGKKPGIGDGKTYTKWVYLPDEDVFVGASDESTGILVYKHPSSGGIPITDKTAQSYIDAAPDTSGNNTVPDSYYASGIIISGDKNVVLQDPMFMGSVDGKAAIHIKGGNVNITGPFSNVPLHGNPLVALRAEGTFNLTLTNSTPGNADGGVMLGNLFASSGTSTAVLTGCTMANCGSPADPGYEHAIYCDEIASLLVDSCITTSINYDGQGVKSRAGQTTVRNHRHEKNILANRCVGFPQGGVATIDGGYFEIVPGPNNGYAIKYGDEDPTKLHNWPANTLTFAGTSIWNNIGSTGALFVYLPAVGTPFYPSSLVIEPDAKIVLIGNWGLGHIDPSPQILIYATEADARAAGFSW